MNRSPFLYALVLDQNPRNRAPLMAQLNALGFRNTYFFHQTNAFLGAVDECNGRSQLILLPSDVNLSTHLEHIAANPFLGNCPVVVTRQGSLQSTHPRIDGTLRKPFSKRLLLKSARAASIHNFGRRSSILVLARTNSANTLSDFFMRHRTRHRKSQWEKLFLVSNTEEFSRVLNTESTTIGAIILESSLADTLNDERLNTKLDHFRKSPANRTVCIAALSPHDSSPKLLRNSVELSLKIPFNFQIFDQFLMDLCTLGQGKWSLSQAFGPYHQALSRGKFSEALKCLEGLPQNQRRNPNLLWRRAHIQSLTGHPQAALALFERCLQLSPFLVPAHYYATELLARFQEIERAKLFAQNAVLLCPNHLQLRSLAQRVLRLPERKEELS